MSVEVINTTINAAKTVKERTWRATQFTEDEAPFDGSNYSCTIYRERKTSIEGMNPTYSRERIAPEIGEPTGDGTSADQYVDAKLGFEPVVSAKMVDIIAGYGSDMITVTHPNPAIGEVSVPAAVVPLLLQAIYDLVATNENQKKLDDAIAAAVAQAQEDQA